MENNVNISEFQKIIFANNINETAIHDSETDNIKSLSEQYPFVVFFTKYKDENITNNNVIQNIWHEGIRLTRFVGIDPDHNRFTVEGHSFKLLFNYDSGLLGIYEENKLESVILVEISYIDLNGETITINIYDGITDDIEINSINNKFTLTYEYVGDNTSASDITEINNTLSFIPITDNDELQQVPFFSENLSNAEYVVDTQNTNKMMVKHNFTINYDTLLSDWSSLVHIEQPIAYNVKSLYNSNIEINPLNIKFRLNPISYDAYCIFDSIAKRANLYKDENIEDFSFDNLIKENTIYNLYIELKPNRSSLNNLSSYSFARTDDERILQLKVYIQTIINDETINEQETTNDITHESDRVQFNIETPSIGDEDSCEMKVHLTLQYIITDSNETIQYQNNNELNVLVDKWFKFNVNTAENQYVYYYGFDDPRNNTLADSEFKSFAEHHNFGDIIYDSNTEGIGQELRESSQDTERDFYIALPVNTDAKICLDIYHTENNIKMYEPLEDNIRFTKLQDVIHRQGTTLNVYQSITDYKGIFYGKIQIQNQE